MRYWRPCLLLACILFSGCAQKSGNRANTSPAPASTGPSQHYTYSAPRSTVSVIHRAEVKQTPVTHSPHAHVALLTPRMQGIYGVNPTSRNLSDSASVADKQPASPGESAGDDKTVSAPASDQISNQPVVAANLLPIPISEPSYAGPIIVVAIFVGLIYYALYRIAGSGRQMTQPYPAEGGSEITTSDSRQEDAQTLARIKMELERVEELHSKVVQFEQTKEEICRDTNPPAETKTDSSSTPVERQSGSDGHKSDETRHEATLPAIGRNDSAGPSINYNYDASGEKIGEVRPGSALFSNVRTESSNEPIALHYDKDGKCIEDPHRKTEFFGGIIRDAD